ncbi:MAG: RNA-guided endonuclease InsQ/TnpB family protein [Promethearchaeota archaeon]
MLILRGYKTELQLNNRQRTRCRQHAGCARFAYNWGLHRKLEEYHRTGRSLCAMELHRELNQLKQRDFPWMYEVSKCAPQEALRHLDRAFTHFFRRQKKGKPGGFPQFKSRKQGSGSFRLTGAIHVFVDSIQLPRLGCLRLKEHDYLPAESDRVHILSATVSEQAGRWYVALQVHEEITVPNNEGPVVGVDVGLHRLATMSDGTTVANPQTSQRYERKLQRVQRSLSRKRRKSRNWAKTRRRLQKLHKRLANIRRDVLHKTTTWLAKTKSVIVLEDLHVAGMRKHPYLAQAVSDASWGEFRRQLEYKTLWYGSELVVAPRFFPSSKTCSGCGHLKEALALSERVFRCERCGLTVDRDVNASYNLVLVAASSAETRNAWPEAGGDRSHLGSVPVDEAGTEQKIT